MHIQHKDAHITHLQSSLQNAARSHSDNHRQIAHLQSELEKTTHETAGKANNDIEMDGMGDGISFDQNSTAYSDFRASFTGPYNAEEEESMTDDEEPT